MSISSKVALVTGGSRGIGRVAALELAQSGFSVVVTDRQMGEQWLDEGFGDTAIRLPGSVESVVAEITARGGEAIGAVLDLLDRPSIDSTLDLVGERFGRLDLLYNNGLYQGPELMAPMAEFSMKAAEDSFLGTVINQVYLSRRAIGMMKRQGEGRLIFITSLASVAPPNPSSGFLYAAGKAAFNRIPEFLDYEHRDEGIRSFLIEPQFTLTDTMRACWGDKAEALAPGMIAYPPEATAKTIAWLALHPDAGRFAGGNLISAPTFFADNGIQDQLPSV